MTATIPSGFEPHGRHSPLTAPWEPIYARTQDDRVVLGVLIAEAHTNRRGFANGGFLAALADNAMGLSCGRMLAAANGLVTVNLAIDYYGVMRIGQWVVFDTHHVRVGRTLCSAASFVTADGEHCARANATFRVVG